MLRVLFLVFIVLVGPPLRLPADDYQGRIISLQGRVDHLPANLPDWSSARVMQRLFIADRVRVFDQSRAAVLFVDETQVRLNAGAELTVRSVRAGTQGSGSLFQLTQGEGWFRTKNSQSGLEIATPAATAAVRGTELDVRVAPDGQTIVTVIEGSVALSNAAGSVSVSAGEEATVRPGEAPVKRVVLHPERAVQWVLYYPTEFAWRDVLPPDAAAETRTGVELLARRDYAGALAILAPAADRDGWARIAAADAALGRGDVGAARELLARAPAGPPSAALESTGKAELAAVALSVGAVDEAEQLIDAALAADAGGVRALVLRSTMRLIQNDSEAALAAALSALERNAGSASALIAAGEALQSKGRIEQAAGYYSHALDLDPQNLRALVDRARVRFGSGDRRGCAQDAAVAERADPNDAAVRSFAGFVALADGRLADAQRELDRAVELAPELAEPHLGLALLAFKRSEPRRGLEENLIATLLEPGTSLYQSYLAKAYHQLRRPAEALAVLQTARRLDPNDPTPWLYASYVYNDLYRFADAQGALGEAIARNDNRAVYRSRSLLDQDLATKNASLAQSYARLGLDARGAHVALRSLAGDFGNASAHIFLANLYGEMPDRLQAQGSELLQYQLLAPVNGNSFTSFNEYTSLFDQPMFAFELYGEGGYPLYGTGQPLTRSGSDRVAHVAYGDYTYADGARTVPDMKAHGFAQVKAAIDPATDLLVSVNYSWKDAGEGSDTVITFGEGSATPVNLQAITLTPDPNASYQVYDLDAVVGFKHSFGAGSPFALALQYGNIQSPSSNPDAPSALPGFLLNTNTAIGYSMFRAQAQQVVKLPSNGELVAGTEYYSRAKSYRNDVTAYDQLTGAEVLSWTDLRLTDDWGAALWLSGGVRLFDRLDVTLGARFQRDVAAHLSEEQSYDYTGLYPFAGLSLALSDVVTLRLAGFTHLNSDLFGVSIAPTSIAGFLFAQNEETYTKRSEASIGIDAAGKRLFANLELTYRAIEYPALSFTLLDGAQEIAVASNVDWLVASPLSVALANQAVLRATDPFVSIGDQLTGTVTMNLPIGLALKVSDRLFVERFIQSSVGALPDSLFSLLDAELTFRFPHKLGAVVVSGTNLLGQSFTTTLQALSTTSLYPYRTLSANVLLRF